MAQKPDNAYEQYLARNRNFWDDAASTFDNEADHGLQNPTVRAAWAALLEQSLPPAPARILDAGCGTGSLSLIMAELGYTVVGVDLSPQMIVLAQQKAGATYQSIDFHIMDAAQPVLEPAQFDAVVCRHVLWTLPEPENVLERWMHLLKRGGWLLLIEGFWHTGAGLHAQEVVDLMPSTITDIVVHDLSQQSQLWDKHVTDERFMVIGKLGNAGQADL